MFNEILNQFPDDTFIRLDGLDAAICGILKTENGEHKIYLKSDLTSGDFLIEKEISNDKSLNGVACKTTDSSQFIYDLDEILNCLVSDSDMDYDEAMEWYSFNINSLSYLKNGPVFMEDYFDEDEY